MLETEESAAVEIELLANAKKKKVMCLNTANQVEIKTIDASVLEVLKKFVYLGSHVWSSTAKKNKGKNSSSLDDGL